MPRTLKAAALAVIAAALTGCGRPTLRVSLGEEQLRNRLERRFTCGEPREETRRKIARLAEQEGIDVPDDLPELQALPIGSVPSQAHRDGRSERELASREVFSHAIEPGTAAGATTSESLVIWRPDLATLSLVDVPHYIVFSFDDRDGLSQIEVRPATDGPLVEWATLRFLVWPIEKSQDRTPPPPRHAPFSR